MRERYTRSICGLLMTAGVFISFNPAFGQLTVVSSFPEDGATAVDTGATFQITFSSPLDTSVRFDSPEDFFLNLIIYPDSLVHSPDSITLSSDSTSVYVHNLHLFPGTDYLFLLAGAVSSTGDSLIIPYLIAFSTGDSLPAATLSGTVDYPDGNPTGVAVLLMDEYPIGEEEVGAHSGAIIGNSDGSYTVNYVPPGVCWPVAVKDFSLDEEEGIALREGSGIGFYDLDDDGEPDSLVISPGHQVVDVDISMVSLSSATARSNYTTVEDAALRWASDAVLVRVGGGDTLDPSGESIFWFYGYYSSSLAEHRAFLAMGPLVFPLEMDEPLDDTTAIPDNWIDSDRAADSAEAHGGSQFRAENEGAMLEAFLGYFTMDKAENKRDTYEAILNTVQIDIRFPAIWYFIYYSEITENEMALLIDAATGEVFRPITAREAEEAATEAAQSWSTDASLLLAMTHQGAESIDPNGEATFWIFAYYSPSLDSLWQVFTYYGLPVHQETGHHSPSFDMLPTNWIDSDSVAVLAEAHGGNEYRIANSDAVIWAILSRGIFMWDRERAVWRFLYTAPDADSLDIFLDAITGELLAGVHHDPSVGGAPQAYTLEQNYPNPFNASTAITYSVPRSVERFPIALVVYNLLGQKVRTLVEGLQSSGHHRVVWDGKDDDGQEVSSGVYLYRLRGGEHEVMGRMTLER